MPGIESRVLALVPTRKDAQLTQAMLAGAGIACHPCADITELCAQLERGVGVVLMAEEALAKGKCLREWLARQPPWSDLPLLVSARPGADSAVVAQAMTLLGNVTVLERPTRIATLVSSVRAALRARQRQYQIREHLAGRERTELLLRSNDRRKDEFLAILAHELRNPLSPITNALQLLRLTESADKAVARIGRMMERQVGNLRRLVDDLMEVSRITRDKIELRREWVELDSVLRTAVESSQPLIDASQHRLIVEMPAEPVVLQADPLRLAQVFANLLNNAAKFTDPGGHIRLTVQANDGSAVVSVRDSGIGIHPDMLSRIFELFAQADQNFNRTQGGLGIGLMLVRRLVELHGGTVTVTSPGHNLGSEFVVRIPLPQIVQPADVARGPPAPAAVLNRHSVLVVDDNEDAADSLTAVLQILGATVRTAYSGPHALAILEDFSPGIAILDIGMRGMDGLELAQRIRARPESDGVTLIALTGWGQPEDVQATLTAGFHHHLVKPAGIDALERLLEEILPLPSSGQAA